MFHAKSRKAQNAQSNTVEDIVTGLLVGIVSANKSYLYINIEGNNI